MRQGRAKVFGPGTVPCCIFTKTCGTLRCANTIDDKGGTEGLAGVVNYSPSRLPEHQEYGAKFRVSNNDRPVELEQSPTERVKRIPVTDGNR